MAPRCAGRSRNCWPTRGDALLLIRKRAYARAGLIGNPSDALDGAALAVPIPTMRATVTLRSSGRLRVRGPNDEGTWATMDALDRHASRFGHEGADRLVTAALVTLWRYARARDLSPAADPFEVDWTTTIPRSVCRSCRRWARP